MDNLAMVIDWLTRREFLKIPIHWDPVPPWFEKFMEKTLNEKQQKELAALEMEFLLKSQEIAMKAQMEINKLNTAKQAKAQVIMTGR